MVVLGVTASRDGPEIGPPGAVDGGPSDVARDGVGPEETGGTAAGPGPPSVWEEPGLVGTVVGGDVVDGVLVVVVGGPDDDGQSVDASEGARGGGSVGLALPSGSKRQPSTSPAKTCHSAGPTSAYVHDEPPWK